MLIAVDTVGGRIQGARGAQRATLGGIIKFNGVEDPFVVANDFICSRLGLIIGLPVPAGAIVQSPAYGPGYVSLQFGGRSPDPPPPIIYDELVRERPSLAAGVVVFDCWIGNEDRHKSNAAYSKIGKTPPAIFDHGGALLGHEDEGLEQIGPRLLRPIIEGELAPRITSAAHFGKWCARIRKVDKHTIRQLAREARSAGALPADAVDPVIEFLDVRKAKLWDLMQNGSARLPRCDPQTWTLV